MAASRSFLLTLLYLALVAAISLAAPTPKTDDAPAVVDVPRIDYDKIQPLPEMIPKNVTGKLYKKFQPYFYVDSGCLPYPVINTKGEISKGLRMDADGSDIDLCRKSKGQVYVRSGRFGDRFAILYSYYLPRDRTWVASINEAAGHIHDWEQTIVWLDGETDQAKIEAISPSGHGGFKTYPLDDFTMKGTHPLITYGQNFDRVRNHQLLEGDEDEVGQLQKIVEWTEMSDVMRKNLNTPKVFNGCTPGIVDSDFSRFLEAAAAKLEE